MGEAVSLTVEKQKDAEMMDPIWMNTSSVELSTDALALESDTSLVLTRTDKPTGGDTKGLRPAQRAVLDALTEALIQHGKPSPGGENYPAGVQVVDEAQWRNIALAKSISTGNPDAERKAFSRAAEALIQRNIAAKWQNLVWRVKT